MNVVLSPAKIYDFPNSQGLVYFPYFYFVSYEQTIFVTPHRTTCNPHVRCNVCCHIITMNLKIAQQSTTNFHFLGSINTKVEGIRPSARALKIALKQRQPTLHILEVLLYSPSVLDTPTAKVVASEALIDPRLIMRVSYGHRGIPMYVKPTGPTFQQLKMSAKAFTSSMATPRTVGGGGSSATSRSQFKDEDSIPIISHSVISMGSEMGDNVTKLEIIPSSPDEHPFLQLEPACYIGPQKYYSDTEAQERMLSSKSRILNVMSLEDLKQRILSVGFKEAEKLTILDQMFPPKVFAADGKRWRVHVSKVPAGAEDPMKLFQRYDELKEERRASEIGYCPILDDLIHGLFDECIRQEVLTCPERGILLANIRNCLNRISMALEALYEGSQLKSMRSTTALSARKYELQAQADDKTEKIASLRAKITSTRLKIKETQAKNDEKMKTLKKKHQEELEYHKKIADSAKSVCEKAVENLSPSASVPAVGGNEKRKTKGSMAVVFTSSRQ